MYGLEDLAPEVAADLIKLINSLKKIPKTAKVAYSVMNRSTNKWSKKEFSYVPLDNILEKIKQNNDFAFLQPIGYDEKLNKFGVKCVLIHKSGKSLISNLYEIPIKEGAKIQDEGAEITYRKRYAAGAFLGIATEEDTDGNDEDAEQINDVITLDYAKNYKLNFGKHDGETLGDLIEFDSDYLDWLYSGERTDKHIKDCIKCLYDNSHKKVLTKNEENEMLALINKTNILFETTETDREKVYEYYGVKSNSEMTLEQLRELVGVLEKRQK